VRQHPTHAKKILVDVVAIHRVVQVFTKNIVELSAESQANRLGFAQSKLGKLLTNISDSSATMLDVVSCKQRLASAKINFAKRFCTIGLRKLVCRGSRGHPLWPRRQTLTRMQL